MLGVPTKGGPIGLPETSVQILMVLDNLTDYVEGSDVPVSDIIGAVNLARRFQLTGVVLLLKEDLFVKIDHAYAAKQSNAPTIFAFACQSKPIDRRLAQAALDCFEDCMPMDHAVYRTSFDSKKKRRQASPSLDNLCLAFVESLGVVGAIAYSKALDDCKEEGRNYWTSWDWSSVPHVFAAHVDQLEK
jgi:hypothetical protein